MDVTNKVTLVRERLANPKDYLEEVHKLNERRKKAVDKKDYDGATRVIEAKDRLVVQNMQKKTDRESKRQREEQKNLDKALKILNHRTTEDWELEIAKVNEECDTKIMHLKEQHDMQRRELENELTRWKESAFNTPKYSKTMLELVDCEKKLARQNLFYDARIVSKRLDVMQKNEEDRMDRETRERFDRQRSRLRRRQEDELKGLTEKLMKVRLGAEKKKQQALQRLQTSFKIHEMDMHHAHKLEYICPSDLSNTVNPNASRDTTASTFRGSLLLEKLAGKKTDVPSLCTLHQFDWEGENS